MSTIVRRTSLFASLAIAAAAAGPASADEMTEQTGSNEGSSFQLARGLADDGAFTPGILRAGDATRGVVEVSTSWNGARDQASLDLEGEVRIWGPIRVVARVEDATRDTARPGAGVGVHILDEARHGVASTAYLLYKTEGFTEPEGELEAVLSFGRALGPVRAGLSVAYGQDPEGNERDGEVAAMLHVEPVRGVFAGVTGRFRDALGSRGEAGVIRDVIAGATGTVTIDRFAITALAGIAGIQTQTTDMSTGLAATLAVGAAF